MEESRNGVENAMLESRVEKSGSGEDWRREEFCGGEWSEKSGVEKSGLWRNYHWTRVDKVQGAPECKGPPSSSTAG